MFHVTLKFFFSSAKSGRAYVSVRDLLEKEHPYDTVLGFPFTRIRSRNIVKKIMDGDLEGFIGLRGGRETYEDKVSRLFSFIPQRCKVREEEVGQVTKTQMQHLYGDKAKKELQKHLNKFFTLTKSYCDYQTGGLTVMSTTLFKWLVEKRGLAEFEVVHFLAYRYKNYLRSFLEPMLLRRQKLKEEIKSGNTGAKVTSEILKLTGNSFYGFSSCMINSYAKTVVRSSAQLEDRRSKHLENARSVSLIGCTPGKNNDDNSEEIHLLYAITKNNDTAKIQNICQLAAAILSNSKVLFFDCLFFFFRCFSPKRAEICYLDTDSAIYSISRIDLEELVEKKHLDEYRDNVGNYLHLGEADIPAHGKFKIETICESGLFHSSKCYWLGKAVDIEKEREEKRGKKRKRDDDNDESEAPSMKRFKGTSRGVQDSLQKKHFDLNKETGLPVGGFANRTKLAATGGFEMLMVGESKALVNPITIKRKYEV